MKIPAILLGALLVGLAKADQPSLGDQALGAFQGAGDQMMAGLTGTGPAAANPPDSGTGQGSDSTPAAGTGTDPSQQPGADQSGQPQQQSPPAQDQSGQQPGMGQPQQQQLQQQPQQPLPQHQQQQQQPPLMGQQQPSMQQSQQQPRPFMNYMMQQQQQPQQSSSMQQASQTPLTADEMAAMDLKMATIKDAFEVLLDFRKQHPQLTGSSELQNLYRMLEPIVQAADQVDSCTTGAPVSCPGSLPSGPLGGGGLQSRRPLRRPKQAAQPTQPQQPAAPLMNGVQPQYL